MRFIYCPDCGAKLIQKEIGDEGLMPWCDTCKKPLFDMFPSCVIALVTDGAEQVLLLRQSYISTQYHNLVSGYIKPGENAENAAEREILEETGIKIKSLELAGTYWFAKKEMLMIGCIAVADKVQPVISAEVDSAGWFNAFDAEPLVHPNGASGQLVRRYIGMLKNR